MVRKYSRRPRKVVRRTRRNYRRRAPMYKSPRTNMLVTKRSYISNFQPPSYPTSMLYPISLSSLPSAAEFTELFDQYRILRIKATWMPRPDWTNTLGSSDANAIMYVTTGARRGIAADYDTENEYLEDSRFVSFKINRSRTFYFVPNVLMEAYESVTTTGYNPRYKQWLTTNDITVPHYGLSTYVVAFGSAPPNGTLLGRWLFTLYIQLKGVH